MRWIYALVIVGVLLFGYTKLAKKREKEVAEAIDGPEQILEQVLFSKGDPCAEKKACLSVYLRADEKRSQDAVVSARKIAESWNPSEPTTPTERAVRVLIDGGSARERAAMQAGVGLESSAIRLEQPLPPWVPQDVKAPAWFYLDESGNVVKSVQGFVPNPADPDGSIRVELEIP